MGTFHLTDTLNAELSFNFTGTKLLQHPYFLLNSFQVQQSSFTVTLAPPMGLTRSKSTRKLLLSVHTRPAMHHYLTFYMEPAI